MENELLNINTVGYFCLILFPGDNEVLSAPSQEGQCRKWHVCSRPRLEQGRPWLSVQGKLLESLGNGKSEDGAESTVVGSLSQ